MRKLTVGLLVLGLLVALTGPVMAQVIDPLGLIASGVVLPYLGSIGDTVAFGNPLVPGSQAWLEIYSPTGVNVNLHMFYYSQACNRGPESVGLPMTTNDVELFRLDFTGSKNPVNGLVTLARSLDGFNLEPLSHSQVSIPLPPPLPPLDLDISTSPIVARVLWVQPTAGWIRTIDPIQVASADAPATEGFVWNPLRTAAMFFAPREIAGFEGTTMYFVCPNTNISSDSLTAAFPHSLFPAITPSFHLAGTQATLRYRIYDLDERFLRDFTDSCNCLTQRSLASPSMPFVYQDVNEAPDGTYTEVEGWKGLAFTTDNEQPFVAYRAVRFTVGGGIPNIDVFSRMSGAHNTAISGGLALPLQQR